MSQTASAKSIAGNDIAKYPRLVADEAKQPVQVSYREAPATSMAPLQAER
jgi:hypothetical protein